MRDITRISSIFFFTGAHGSQESFWSPRVDVYRSGDGWLIKFELAGIRPEDITIAFDGSRLSVSGIRRDWFIEEGYDSYSMEISYSRFERTITLFSEPERGSVSSEYHDGMLLVKVTT
jgi:HSP20 family protein